MMRQKTTAPPDDPLAPENVLAELAATLEDLQITHEELNSQNEELSAMQAALVQERGQYRELFEFAPDGYLVTDEEGVIVSANRPAATLLNVPQRYLVGKPLIVFVVTGDRQAFHSRLTQVRNGQRIHNWRVQLQPRYETPIITAVAATPAVEGTSGQVRWLFRNITERARAEEMTKKHRERLAGILNSAMDAIISIDENLRITLFNPAAERVFRYDVAEVLGRPVDLLLPERFQERHRDYIRDFGRTDETGRSMSDLGTVYGRRATGEEFPIEASISQVETDGERFYTIILRDITDRMETEQRLRRRRQELETLAQVSFALRRAETRENVIPHLIAQTIEVLHADAGVLVIREEEEFVSFHLDSSDLEDTLRRQQTPSGSIPLWHTLPAHEPLFIAEVTEQDQLGQCPVWQTVMTDMSAGVAVALYGDTETIALLILGYRARDGFSADETDLLAAIADIAGSALQRMNLMNTLERRVSDRTRELSALYEITSLASESLDLSTVLSQSLEGVISALDAEMGGIHLHSESDGELRLACHHGVPSHYLDQYDDLSYDHNISIRVLEQNKPLLIPDLSADPRIPEFAQLPRSYIGVPMHASGRILGVLSIVGTEFQQFRAEEVALLSAIGDQVAVAVENARLHRRSKQTAVSEERQRVARELHDSVTQHLYGLRLYADAAREFAEAGALDSVQDTLAQLDETLQHTFVEMRLLIHELRPAELEQRNLVDALRDRLRFVENRVGLQTRIQVDDVSDLPVDVEQLLYRVTQEALNNVVKHARAGAVTVQISTVDDDVELQVIDDGIGFDVDSVRNMGGMGLSGIRERVQGANGVVKIDSTPGAGTTITVRIPLVERKR